MVRFSSRAFVLSVAVFVAVASIGCKGGRQRRQSESARWVDNPTTGAKSESVIRISPLRVEFEIPDTLYVYRTCDEASHTSDGSHPDWIPVIQCTTEGGTTFAGFDDERDDSDAGGVEDLLLNIYVTHKTRPLDERAVSWFENQYKEAGLQVEELSYQGDFQKKNGIYAKLRVVGDDGHPQREIVQFLFSRQDVVFIARIEYPFGETRSVEQDWKYVLWNFNFLPDDRDSP